jgi:hypothetical protein
MSNLSPEKFRELEGLAGDVMDIVLQVARRRLAQVMEEVHDTNIAPLRKALRDCQSLTPSLMTGDQAIERLKEINVFVYSMLGHGRPDRDRQAF